MTGIMIGSVLSGRAPAIRRRRGHSVLGLTPHRLCQRPRPGCRAGRRGSPCRPARAPSRNAGASSINGPARMLAMIRSNGARAASIGEVHAVGDGQQQLARAMPELHAVDRGIVARDVDRDRVDVGRDALAPPARAPAPRRRAGRCRCRCRRHWRKLVPARSSRSSAARQPAGGRVLAGAEGEAGVDLEIDRVRRIAARCVGRVDEEAAGADRLQARPGSSSPNRSSPSCSTRGCAGAEARAARQAPRSSARARNRRGSASRRASVSSGSSATSTGGASPKRGTGRRIAATASPCARVQGRVTRQLMAPCSFASRSSSAARPRCGIGLAGVAGRSAAPCPRAGRSDCWRRDAA